MSEEEKQDAEWNRPEEELPENSKGKSVGEIVVMILVALFVISALAGLSAPKILRAAKASERTEAINNAKQVGLALLEFDQEYGSFPDEETAAMVREATKTELDLSGHTSNAMFRQLIANGVQSEDIFFCLHPETGKPDGNMRPGKALEAGEVGFSYLAGQNTSGNPGRSVLFAPMIIGTEQFWPKPFQQKAVLLRLDNSVEAPLIRSTDGRVSVGNGKTIFDTGSDTVWGDDFEFDLRHPEK